MSQSSSDSAHSIHSSIHDNNGNYPSTTPVAYDPEQNEDAMSEVSQQLSNTVSRVQSLKVQRTETTKSLKEMGLNDQLPVSDINRPQNIENPIFPEEYTMETETGLVPVQTLREMGRTPTTLSRIQSRRESGAESESSSSGLEKKEEEAGGENGGESGLNSVKEYDPEITFVTFLVNDKENPYNWSLTMRWVYTLTLSCVVVSVAYGSSCVTGSLNLIEEKYNVSQEVAILSCSLMVLGFAVGPLLWSPMSETVGRRPTYFVSLLLYTIFNIPCAVAPNIGTILVCRFLCGVFSSSGLCLVPGSIADMFPGSTRGKAIAYFAALPYAGPVFGPLVTGFINIGSGRLDLVFWVNMAFAGAMWIASSLIPETYAPIILKRRAAKLRKETGNPNLMTEQEANKLTIKELIETVLYRPIMFAVTEPVLDLMCFYVCLIYSLLYAFFTAYPVIFGELYGYNDMYVGMMLIPIIIGAGMALFTTPVLEKFYVKMCQRRAPTPEDRLIGAMLGSPFPVIALFILGATSYKHIIWVGPASAGLAFGYGMVLIYYSINNYIIDCYSKFSASAMATKVFLRSAGGAAFPLFTTQMYHRLGLQWASWLLAFISLAMVLIPFSFYKFGGGLRVKLSKANYSEF